MKRDAIKKATQDREETIENINRLNTPSDLSIHLCLLVICII